MNSKIIKIAEIGLNHMGSEKNLNKYKNFLMQEKIDGITIQIPRKSFFKGKFKNLYLTDKQITNFIISSKKKWNFVGIATSDYEKIDFFAKLNIDFFKVTSGMISNIKLIKKMIRSNVKQIYLSTGFSSYTDIKNILKKINKKKINLIHTSFKKNFKDINLSRIHLLKKKFGLPVAYGNHSKFLKSIPNSVFFKPSSIFFYVKLNKNLPYPDNLHAIKINSVSSILKNVKENETKLGKY